MERQTNKHRQKHIRLSGGRTYNHVEVSSVREFPYHCVQVPYEGSGMNPARAFGPAAVSGYLMENASTHAVSIYLQRHYVCDRRTVLFTQQEAIRIWRINSLSLSLSLSLC